METKMETSSADATNISLFFASMRGQVDEVQDLVRNKGADPNSTTVLCASPPINGAASKGHVDVVRALIQLGVDPNYGMVPPIVAAAQFGNSDVVRALVQLGADPNLTDVTGRTALFTAALGNHTETVRVLLELGADPTITDREGRTPRSVAHTQRIRCLLPQPNPIIDD